MPGRLVGVEQRLGVLVGARRTSLDEVAGDGERRTGEGDQGHREGLDQHPAGLGDVRRVDRRFERSQPGEVGGAAERLLDHRSGARSDVDADPDRMHRDDDVAVEHGCVDAVASHRLEGDLRRQFRLLDRVEDAPGPADVAVFGQAAARLTHEPHRGVHGWAPVAGSEEGRIGRRSGRGVGHRPLDGSGRAPRLCVRPISVRRQSGDEPLKWTSPGFGSRRRPGAGERNHR